MTVEAEVKGGRIGIGCVAPDYRTYVGTESDRTAEDGHVVFDVVIERPGGDGCGWLVVRNTAEGGVPSRVIIWSIRTFRTGATRIPDLVEVEAPAIPEVPRETAHWIREQHSRSRQNAALSTAANAHQPELGLDPIFPGFYRPTRGRPEPPAEPSAV